jgi:hypothetical protein
MTLEQAEREVANLEERLQRAKWILDSVKRDIAADVVYWCKPPSGCGNVIVDYGNPSISRQCGKCGGDAYRHLRSETS